MDCIRSGRFPRGAASHCGQDLPIARGESRALRAHRAAHDGWWVQAGGPGVSSSSPSSCPPLATATSADQIPASCTQSRTGQREQLLLHRRMAQCSFLLHTALHRLQRTLLRPAHPSHRRNISIHLRASSVSVSQLRSFVKSRPVGAATYDPQQQHVSRIQLGVLVRKLPAAAAAAAAEYPYPDVSVCVQSGPTLSVPSLLLRLRIHSPYRLRILA